MKVPEKTTVSLSAGMKDLLERLGCTLLITTDQGIDFIFHGHSEIEHYRCPLPKPGKIAADGRRLAVSGKVAVLEMLRRGRENSPGAPVEMIPSEMFSTPGLHLDEIAYGKDGLWAVESEKCLLGLLDRHFGFMKKWRAPLVGRQSKTAGLELSGLAVDRGEPCFVSARGSKKINRGVDGLLIDVSTSEIVAGGMPSPKSPRIHGTGLFVIFSDNRECALVDAGSGKWETVVRLSQDPVSIACFDRYLFIAVRPKRNLDRKKSEPKPFTGVIVADRLIGEVLGQISVPRAKNRIFDVQILSGKIRPMDDDPFYSALCRLGYPGFARKEHGTMKKLGRSLMALTMSGSFMLPFVPSKAFGLDVSKKGFELKTGVNNPFSGGNPLYDVFYSYEAAPAFVDIDGDGDMDVLVGDYYGYLWFFENIGTASSPEFGPAQYNAFGIVDTTDYYTQPAFSDIDGDGDFDLFYGSKNYIYFAENTGTATQPQFSAPVKFPFGISMGPIINGLDIYNFYNAAPQFVDIDGDGDFDLFYGAKVDYIPAGGESYEFGTIMFQENTGDKYNPSFGPLQFSPFNIYPYFYYSPSPHFVDIDGDGLLDLFVGDVFNDIYFQKNTGTKMAPSFGTLQYNPFGIYSDSHYDTYYGYLSPYAVDIDGDGDMDLFLGEGNGDIQFHRNIGNKTNPNFQLYGADVGIFSSPRFGKVTKGGGANDGVDAFSGNNFGEFPFFENMGSPTAPSFPDVQWRAFGLDYLYGTFSIPALADIDGDGDLDLFSGGYYGNIYFYQNNGTANLPSFGSYQLNPFGLSPVYYDSAPNFGDLNGDQLLDVIVGDYYGNFIFFPNTGNKTQPKFSSYQVNPFGLTPLYYYTTPMLVDFDGDGDLDLFSGNFYGGFVFFENTGSPQSPAFSSPAGNPFGLSQRFPVRLDAEEVRSLFSVPELVDINGDGTLDAFLGDYSGRIHFFRGIDVDLKVEKTADPDPAVAGAPLTYTIRVDNLGDDDATNVTVADMIPGQVTVTNVSGCDSYVSDTCSLGTIAGGGSKQYTISVDVNPSALGMLTNQATASTDLLELRTANNTATLDTQIDLQSDLSITIDGEIVTNGMLRALDAKPGQEVQFTVTVRNDGPSDANDVVISNLFSSFSQIDSYSTSGCAEDPNGVPTCSLGTIAAGTEETFTINAKLSQDFDRDIILRSTPMSGSDDPLSQNDNGSFTVVPTLSQWGAILLAGLLAMVSIMKRRKANGQ